MRYMKGEEIIEKTVKMTEVHNTKGTSQYIVRVPKEIEEFLDIKKGDRFAFIIQAKEPKENSELKFKIIRGKKDGKSKG